MLEQAKQEFAVTATGADAGVELDHLTKVFPRGNVVAVEEVSAAVWPGEFVSLVGPSGCGKSTLLRLVAGLIEPTAGAVSVRGQPVVEPRADIAMMFQKPTLLPWKTAEQNVLLPKRIAGELGSETRRQAHELLQMVGLNGFEHAYPAHLSGGMQQRVALARTLITGADLLLMDEPFAALDEFTREALNLELLRIQGEFGTSVMFVTHNISEAVFLADRVFVMTPRPGRLARIVDVPIERPRTTSVFASSQFNELAFEVRTLLEDHG